MPALPCPLGNGCKSGPGEATWQTIDVALDDAKWLLTEHIKVAHQVKDEAAGGDACRSSEGSQLGVAEAWV